MRAYEQAAIHIDDSDSSSNHDDEEETNENGAGSPSSTVCCAASRSTLHTQQTFSKQTQSLPGSFQANEADPCMSARLNHVGSGISNPVSQAADDQGMTMSSQRTCCYREQPHRTFKSAFLKRGGIKEQSSSARGSTRTRSRSFDEALSGDPLTLQLSTLNESTRLVPSRDPFSINGINVRKWKNKSGGPARSSHASQIDRKELTSPYSLRNGKLRRNKKLSSEKDKDVDRELSLYMHMWKL